mgnify:CR=1 FL=1
MILHIVVSLEILQFCCYFLVKVIKRNIENIGKSFCFDHLEYN